MAGINVGNFWSRMMPGAINALGQQFGGDMADSARGASSLLGARKQPKGPKVTNGIPRGQMPGQQMPMPQIPPAPPMGGGINTGPTPPMMNSFMPSSSGGHGFWNPGAKGPLQLEMNGSPIGTFPSSSGDSGGIFNRYNRIRF